MRMGIWDPQWKCLFHYRLLSLYFLHGAPASLRIPPWSLLFASSLGGCRPKMWVTAFASVLMCVVCLAGHMGYQIYLVSSKMAGWFSSLFVVNRHLSGESVCLRLTVSELSVYRWPNPLPWAQGGAAHHAGRAQWRREAAQLTEKSENRERGRGRPQEGQPLYSTQQWPSPVATPQLPTFTSKSVIQIGGTH